MVATNGAGKSMSEMQVSNLLEHESVTAYSGIVEQYQSALQVVDDVVLKSYVTRLSDLDVIPLEKSFLERNIRDNVLFFKINEMVYEKDEFASYKFASVFNSLSWMKCAIFVIIDSDGSKTDFYMGVRSYDPDRTTRSLKDTLENALSGQFPGIKTEPRSLAEVQSFLDNLQIASISAVSCVANPRNEHLRNNAEFVQGLEKLVLSLRGKRYTGIILANTTEPEQLRALRKGYEDVYTKLSPFASVQVSFGQNIAQGQSESVADGTSESVTNTSSTSRSEGHSEGKSESDTKGSSTSLSESSSNSITHSHGAYTMLKGVSGVAVGLGAVLAPVTGGTSVLLGVKVAAGAGLMGTMLGKKYTDSQAKSTSRGSSINRTEGTTSGTSHTETIGDSKGDTTGSSHTVSVGTNVTSGSTKGVTLIAKDKAVENLLQRLDQQLQRIEAFESLGMFECAAYFASEDQCTAEMAAATYKALVGGEKTGVEVAAINSWGMYSEAERRKTRCIAQYVKNLVHPVFVYNGSLGKIEVTPGALVSGTELAIHMGLPRKSVCGLPVVEHSEFGQEAISYNGVAKSAGIKLGKIFHMGRLGANDVVLDKNSMTMHTFVTGATGSGKSNTVFELIRQCRERGASFLVIEPVKGEYKHMFGANDDVKVLGSNLDHTELLRINPFKFPAGLHVLEHVDRLVEIFNVCWPMYAAMPAVLKDALLKSYEDCGWDFATSTNVYDENLFPTFADLKRELIEVLDKSAYSAEVKSNYAGSLVTRVNSLTNGLNGQMFTFAETDNATLFDSNVIIDLSRIGSVETKSLIMGLLVLKLSEYRLTSADDFNVPLKHVTILEEAHNILKRTSTEQNPESPSLVGKSVEMIANAIAEMRAFGEGFIIVDQSPSAVDNCAIRNTNTKIIMRLPDEADRRAAGKAAGLRDAQLDEIAKLPKGVAVVYQNDWIEAVLCKINRYSSQEGRFVYRRTHQADEATPQLKKKLLDLLLKPRVNKSDDVDIAGVRNLLGTADLDSRTRLTVNEILSEYECCHELRVWNEARFAALAAVVADLFHSGAWLGSVLSTVSDYHSLTNRLIEEVKRQAPQVDDSCALAAAQCFMKHASREAEQNKEVYIRWISELRYKGVF